MSTTRSTSQPRPNGGTRRKATAASASHLTTDHEEIRHWAESRGGEPACVKGTGKGSDQGVLRIDFPGYSGQQTLQHIGWDEWFDKFDSANLALVYQEKTSGGQTSNFNKLVSRDAPPHGIKKSASQGSASHGRYAQ